MLLLLLLRVWVRLLHVRWLLPVRLLVRVNLGENVLLVRLLVRLLVDRNRCAPGVSPGGVPHLLLLLGRSGVLACCRHISRMSNINIIFHELYAWNDMRIKYVGATASA